MFFINFLMEQLSVKSKYDILQIIRAFTATGCGFDSGSFGVLITLDIPEEYIRAEWPLNKDNHHL